nr:MAG TPA: hypothetical protein [Caudoviricetes sp.]
MDAFWFYSWYDGISENRAGRRHLFGGAFFLPFCMEGR